MSNSFRSSRFIYKFAEPVITGEEGEEIIVQKDAISTIEVVALMMVTVMTNITMSMTKMVTNTMMLITVAAQVTYPDFSYDCEALAVDPVTRYSIASNNVAKTSGLVLKYLLWATLLPNL